MLQLTDLGYDGRDHGHRSGDDHDHGLCCHNHRDVVEAHDLDCLGVVVVAVVVLGPPVVAWKVPLASHYVVNSMTAT